MVLFLLVNEKEIEIKDFAKADSFPKSGKNQMLYLRRQSVIISVWLDILGGCFANQFCRN